MLLGINSIKMAQRKKTLFINLIHIYLNKNRIICAYIFMTTEYSIPIAVLQ